MRNSTKNKNLFSHLKCGKKIIKLGDIEVEKHKFHHYKNPSGHWLGINI